jgi:hypothetical protein
MMRIRYSDQLQLAWAKEFLRLCEPLQIPTRVDPHLLEVEIGHNTLGRLLQRACDLQQVTIVPSFITHRKPEHRWLVVGPDQQKLEQALNRIRNFLVPTYAVFVDDPVPLFHSFETETSSPLLKLTARLYPEGGYCVLRSRPEDRENVLRRLDIWMQLETESPPPQLEERLPTYAMLYERFQIALATAQWDEAKQLRLQIQAHGLTAAENLLFLEIEQLARQQRWKDIWRHKDCQQLTKTRIPRPVRAALLTAFHQTYLLEAEQQGQWERALAIFSDHQPELGLLLTGRLGLTQGPVVQVFAYQAVVEKKRGDLLELIGVTTDSAALECIKQLLSLLGPESVVIETKPSSPFDLAQAAINLGDFDGAWKHALKVEDEGKQVFLLLMVAFYTYDQLHASEALLLYWNLSQDIQDTLHTRYPVLTTVVSQLESWVDQDLPQPAIEIRNWLDWFAHLAQEPQDPLLLSTLEQVAANSDERFWTIEHIGQVSDQLMLLDSAISRLPVMRDALRKLIAYFLNDEQFPRVESIYQDLYENLYNTLLAKTAQEEMSNDFILLRLASALLAYAPNKREHVQRDLAEWCVKPIVKLENWALETFELLIDYGLEPGLLTQWYRAWIEELFYKQTHHQLTNLEGWLELGRIIQPGEDLIHVLENAISTTQEKEGQDPIQALPKEYSVAIYSLQETAAQRARRLLLKRNEYLDIRICTDTVFSEAAKALAKHADVFVLVTTAMKHAMSYGLNPLLDPKQIVYPPSSGSTSIVRSVEEYARATYGEEC